MKKLLRHFNYNYKITIIPLTDSVLKLIHIVTPQRTKLKWRLQLKFIQSLPQTQILEILDVNCIDISNLDFLTNRIYSLKYLGS